MIDSKRIFSWNNREPNPEGLYVLYWMQIHRRLEFNFALEHAVEWANRLGKPLLIYEGLACDYPWASDRLHQFLLEGMKENHDLLMRKNVAHHSFVEMKPGEGAGLVRTLCASACVVITDHFPVFIIRTHNERIGPSVAVPYISVDANGILPLGISIKAPYSAFEFRRWMQKHFLVSYAARPRKNPLSLLKANRKAKVPSAVLRKWPDRFHLSDNIPELLRQIPIDHSVSPVSIQGTRQAARKGFRSFLKNGLLSYAEQRNHPDLSKTSGMSPYLHFGKISSHEMIQAALDQQPAYWSLETVRYCNGAREGFFGGNRSIQAFLDQLITWRETGYHYCQHVPDYDRFESLPEWARLTLHKHRNDPRPYIYDLESPETAQTHDPVWNAAQRQLLREGVIHNYLRMLWGKKILEWTPNPETALQYLITLNNKYSIDGRNPNSYSGIFWILGRFDRPWGPERNIFGTVRWMSSENTIRKIKLKEYLRLYGP